MSDTQQQERTDTKAEIRDGEAQDNKPASTQDSVHGSHDNRPTTEEQRCRDDRSGTPRAHESQEDQEKGEKSHGQEADNSTSKNEGKPSDNSSVKKTGAQGKNAKDSKDNAKTNNKIENKENIKGNNSEEEKTKGDNEKQNKGNNSDKKEQKEKKTKTRGSESDRSEMSEGRTKQKEFFKLELQRLETSLKRESSKIMAPQKKAYTPYVFNTLEPYYNTYTTRYLIELPDEMHHGYTSRRTAQSLTDPWLDLKMDRELPPVTASKPVSRQIAILKKEKEIRDRKKRSAATQSSQSRKGGSTRLPKFPMVQVETRDLATKQLFYSDVPALRHELKNKYSSSAKTKVAEDYERTQQDFYRMELDKLDEVHPINRKHMRSAYFAYLQNTPGSKKAVTECVRGLKSGKA